MCLFHRRPAENSPISGEPRCLDVRGGTGGMCRADVTSLAPVVLYRVYMGKPEAKVTICDCNLIKERATQKVKEPHDFSQPPFAVGSLAVDASGQHMLARVKPCLAVRLTLPICFSLSPSLCFSLGFKNARLLSTGGAPEDPPVSSNISKHGAPPTEGRFQLPFFRRP